MGEHLKYSTFSGIDKGKSVIFGCLFVVCVWDREFSTRILIICGKLWNMADEFEHGFNSGTEDNNLNVSFVHLISNRKVLIVLIDMLSVCNTIYSFF